MTTVSPDYFGMTPIWCAFSESLLLGLISKPNVICCLIQLYTFIARASVRMTFALIFWFSFWLKWLHCNDFRRSLTRHCEITNVLPWSAKLFLSSFAGFSHLMWNWVLSFWSVLSFYFTKIALFLICLPQFTIPRPTRLNDWMYSSTGSQVLTGRVYKATDKW